MHAVKQVNLPGTSSSQHTLTVRAWGVAANGVWPVMELWVNRQKISSWSVTATAQDYSAPVTLSGRDVVEVLFTNDDVDDHVDRNLRVESLQVDDQAPLPARRGVYDLSVDGPDQATILAAAFDDRDVYPGQTPLNWNGALRFVLGAGAARYGYDANGNRRYSLSARQADVYTYDVENRLHTVERNDTVLERYLYDETGQRLLKSTSTLTTTYVSSAYEVADGVATTYYSFNGQRVALRKGSALTYLHADHLGSTLLATDEQGAVVGNNQPRYFAYGRERTASLAALPTDYTFTGQKQDGSGLIYMNARYYDPQTGQFISPDSEVPDTTNLFDWNRFVYARGNPLKYNDPTGHACDVGITNPVHPIHSAIDCAGPGILDSEVESEVAAETEVSAEVEVQLRGDDAERYADVEATKSVDNHPNSVVSTNKAPPSAEIASSQTSDTVSLENSIAGNSTDAAYLRQLPQRYDKNDTVHGTLIVNGQKYTFEDGWNGGPGPNMPKKASGFDIVTRTHVEGHAAAKMHELEAKYGTLYINDSRGPCSSCLKNLNNMVPKGSTLRLVYGDLYGIHVEYYGVPPK